MSASAKNMEVVVKAKEAHNANCPFGGEAKRVCLHPFDIERMGWEEGDVIVGLTVVSDTAVTTGMLKVECDAEFGNDENKIAEAITNGDLVTV